MHRLWLAWRTDRRRRAAHAAIAEMVNGAHAGQLAAFTLGDVLGGRGSMRGEETDPVATEALLGRLVTREILKPRDILLLVRVHVRGERRDAVARALGLSDAAVKKALHRARHAVRMRCDAAWDLLSPDEGSARV